MIEWESALKKWTKYYRKHGPHLISTERVQIEVLMKFLKADILSETEETVFLSASWGEYGNRMIDNYKKEKLLKLWLK